MLDFKEQTLEGKKMSESEIEKMVEQIERREKNSKELPKMRLRGKSTQHSQPRKNRRSSVSGRG